MSDLWQMCAQILETSKISLEPIREIKRFRTRLSADNTERVFPARVIDIENVLTRDDPRASSLFDPALHRHQSTYHFVELLNATTHRRIPNNLNSNKSVPRSLHYSRHCHRERRIKTDS